MIQEISIPEKVDKCTEDIPVIIQNENNIIYLTKQGILRHHSKFKECIDEYEFMETHGSQIIRKSNLITTIKKNSKKLSFFDSGEIKGHVQIYRYIKYFLNFYRKTFGTNEIFSITRDFIVIFAVILFGIIIVYQIFLRSKQPIKDFFILMFSMLKFLEIKDKTEHDLDGAESVIMNSSSRTDATKEKKKTESQSPDS